MARKKALRARLGGVLLLAAGVIMLYYGWQASQSAGDQFVEALTGSFTDDTTWLLLGGAAAAAAGFYLTFFRR